MALFGSKAENAYDVAPVDLAVARAVATEITKGGSRLRGSSLTVRTLTGTLTLRFNTVASDAILCVAPKDEGVVFVQDFERVFVENAAQAGATAEFYIGRRA